MCGLTASCADPALELFPCCDFALVRGSVSLCLNSGPYIVSRSSSPIRRSGEYIPPNASANGAVLQRAGQDPTPLMNGSLEPGVRPAPASKVPRSRAGKLTHLSTRQLCLQLQPC